MTAAAAPTRTADADPSAAGAATAAALQRTARRLLRLLRPEQADGLTPSQSSLLGTVRDHGPLSLRDVAAHEAVSAPTASRAVEVLVQRGLLRCDSDPADGRRHLIALEPAAETLLDRRVGGGVAVLAAEVDALDARQRAALADALPAIDDLLDALARRRVPIAHTAPIRSA